MHRICSQTGFKSDLLLIEQHKRKVGVMVFPLGEVLKACILSLSFDDNVLPSEQKINKKFFGKPAYLCK